MAGDHHFYDDYLRRMAAEHSGSVFKITMPIPLEYPWEEFLRSNFGEGLPHVEPFKVVLADLDAAGQIKDLSRPHTYHGIFRFLEYMRSGMEHVEVAIPAVEERFRFFRLLAKQQMDVNMVDRKALNRNIRDLFTRSHNLVSHRSHAEQLFGMLVRTVNEEIARHKECNLLGMSAVRTLEKQFSPHLGLLLQKAPELFRLRQQLAKLSEQMTRSRIRLPVDSRDGGP